jgi:hypothetical protein
MSSANPILDDSEGGVTHPRRGPSGVVLAALFATALWSSVPRVIHASREAIERWPLSYEQRREQALGAFYESVQRIRVELPPDETVGISLRDSRLDAGAAVFANYYLYPHPTRFYESLDQYRARVLDDPTQPTTLVRIDTERTAEARLMTYLGVRQEEVAEAPVVRDPKPSAEAHRELIVPFAVAIDGQPGNTYLTEGVLVSDVDTVVTLTFFPGSVSKTFALRAHEPLILRDAVYTIVSRLDAGWLRVAAPVPIRAAFWFVNRGRRHAVPLPLFEKLPPSPQRVAGGEKLWILNPADRAIDVDVSGKPQHVEPHALATLGPTPQVSIASSQPFLAFSARKENGREIFQWP